MPSPHQNADNEYFVHTEPNVVKTGWFGFGTSKKSETSARDCQLQQLQQENAELQKQKQEEQRKLNQLDRHMQRVVNELKSLKVHNYFLQINLPEEQRQQIQREKYNIMNELRLCQYDESYRSKNQSNLKDVTDKLNEYMQKSYHDYYDENIVTLTEFIKEKQLCSGGVQEQ
jgi:chromosome segregation ATPase